MRFRLYFTHGDATDYEAASYRLDWPRIELFNAAGERVLSYYDADIAAVRELDANGEIVAESGS
jgi:hypothetical protein